MVEIVLVSLAGALFHNVEVRHLGQYESQQSAALQVHEASARRVSHENLVQLLVDALGRYYLYALRVTFQRTERLIVDVELQSGGKAYAAQHTQRVVRERDVGIQRRTYDAVPHIVKSVERVNKFAETLLVKTDSHGVDGEVSAVLVIFQCAVLHYGVA